MDSDSQSTVSALDGRLFASQDSQELGGTLLQPHSCSLPTDRTPSTWSQASTQAGSSQSSQEAAGGGGGMLTPEQLERVARNRAAALARRQERERREREACGGGAGEGERDHACP